MIKGFLFGLGFFMALFTIILLFGLVKKLRLKRPTVKMWKEYKKKVLDTEDYAEAEFVQRLIGYRGDHEKTPLPKGYKIEEKAKTILNDGGGDEISLRVDKEYWIVKTKGIK